MPIKICWQICNIMLNYILLTDEVGIIHITTKYFLLIYSLTIELKLIFLSLMYDTWFKSGIETNTYLHSEFWQE